MQPSHEANTSMSSGIQLQCGDGKWRPLPRELATRVLSFLPPHKVALLSELSTHLRALCHTAADRTTEVTVHHTDDLLPVLRALLSRMWPSNRLGALRLSTPGPASLTDAEWSRETTAILTRLIHKHAGSLVRVHLPAIDHLPGGEMPGSLFGALLACRGTLRSLVCHDLLLHPDQRERLVQECLSLEELYPAVWATSPTGGHRYPLKRTVFFLCDSILRFHIEVGGYPALEAASLLILCAGNIAVSALKTASRALPHLQCLRVDLSMQPPTMRVRQESAPLDAVVLPGLQSLSLLDIGPVHHLDSYLGPFEAPLLTELHLLPSASLPLTEALTRFPRLEVLRMGWLSTGTEAAAGAGAAVEPEGAAGGGDRRGVSLRELELSGVPLGEALHTFRTQGLCLAALRKLALETHSPSVDPRDVLAILCCLPGLTSLTICHAPYQDVRSRIVQGCLLRFIEELKPSLRQQAHPQLQPQSQEQELAERLRDHPLRSLAIQLDPFSEHATLLPDDRFVPRLLRLLLLTCNGGRDGGGGSGVALPSIEEIHLNGVFSDDVVPADDLSRGRSRLRLVRVCRNGSTATMDWRRPQECADRGAGAGWA